MLNASLQELSSLLAAKSLSSVELTKGLLARIARLNPTYNAFITIDEEMSAAVVVAEPE